MMNKLAKKMALGLISGTMLATSFGTTALSVSAQSSTSDEDATAIEEASTINSDLAEEKLVTVTLYSDEDKTIITEIPESYVEEYTEKLENDEFKQQEILNSLGSQSSLQTQASTVKYMRENDILEMLDSLDSSRDWLQYITNPIGSTALGAAVNIITNTNIMGPLATVLAWAAEDLQDRQLDWWKDSTIMVLKGEINGVKLTITPSGKDYPKVYRTLERY